jgi:succinate-semialdehyde dehydrogenase/glutarate-semialdehyde dehydrogenase
VQRSIYDQFVDACVSKTQQLRLGNGMDPDSDIGPMIHERQLSLVESQVEDAIAQGARVLAGGSRRADLGPNFYTPTVLTDVTPGMRIMCEETFGPVLPIMAFDTDDQAIRLANDSEFGLAASIWTRSRTRGEQMAHHVRAGTVMINDTVSCFGISEAPHGGVKSSGIGRTHGRYGLEEMVWIKYVDADRLPRMKKVWWYKYGASLGRQVEAMADMQFSSKWSRRIKGALGAAGIVRHKGGV